MIMILVTGATGRVGKELVAVLRRKRKYASNLRIITRDANSGRKQFGKKVQLIEADLSSPADFIPIAEACRGVDAIIHMAALIDYSASEEAMMDANLGSTLRLIEAARLQQKPPKIIFISSTSIYRGVSERKIDERTPPRPTNAYGRAKFLSEKAIRESGLKYVILRPPLVYGKGFRTGLEQVVRLIRKRRMALIGPGGNYIAHIHVSDLVGAILQALETRNVNQAFIVSSGECLTQKELFSMIAKQLHVPAPSIHIPRALAYAGAGIGNSLFVLFGKKPKIFKEYVHTLAESRVYETLKAKKMLQFKPRVKFREGIRDLIAGLG